MYKKGPPDVHVLMPQTTKLEEEKNLTSYIANIHQERHSIKNMQMVSSNRVHSTHSCEANKCRIFKPFFYLSDKMFPMLNIKKIEEDKS